MSAAVALGEGAAGATPAAREGSVPLSLRALAALVGVQSGYSDTGGHWVATTDAARERILAALGHPADDAPSARRTLAALREARDARPVDVSRVAVAGEAAGTLPGRVPEAAGATLTCAVTLTREDATAHAFETSVRADARGAFTVYLDALPGGDVPLGYHRVRVELRWPGGERAGEQALVVVPDRCADPGAALGGERVAGVTANLYAVRSRRNWGAGDLTDLAGLMQLAAANGAAFVGVNPLHALRTSGDEPSPYSPVSRRFRHPLYLDPTAVPEYAASTEARALVERADFQLAIARLRASARVDHAAVLRLKRPVLEALHRAFSRLPVDHARRSGYEAYRREQGDALERFARFGALDEHHRDAGRAWWPDWPADVQRADGAGVDAFAAAHADAVDFHRWCQFEVDRQLAAVAAYGGALGLPVGLYQDLAVGASPAGADVWGDTSLYVRGVSVGAPPDPLGPDGQNWGLPPWNPQVLAERGYADWAALVRAGMRHAGALRVDHALGLFRQFWVPDGASGRDGAYVRFPAEALLGVLALESVRAGALVVGEDLGTVPPEVRPTLQRWGVLASRVLYFERTESGGFVPPREYPRLALATANTHDLAPLAGWWTGRDVDLRREVGDFDEDAAADAHAARGRERWALVRMLVDEGVLDARLLGDDVPSAAEPTAAPAPSLAAAALDHATLRAAVHQALRRAPSWLVGLALEDLVGEPEPVNLPGVANDRFPSWTRRLAVPLENLAGDPRVARAFGAERVWLGRAGHAPA